MIRPAHPRAAPRPGRWSPPRTIAQVRKADTAAGQPALSRSPALPAWSSAGRRRSRGARPAAASPDTCPGRMPHVNVPTPSDNVPTPSNRFRTSQSLRTASDKPKIPFISKAQTAFNLISRSWGTHQKIIWDGSCSHHRSLESAIVLVSSISATRPRNFCIEENENSDFRVQFLSIHTGAHYARKCAHARPHASLCAGNPSRKAHRKNCKLSKTRIDGRNTTKTVGDRICRGPAIAAVIRPISKRRRGGLAEE